MPSARTTSTILVTNGALLIFAGYFCGAAIPHVPYPRLMLAAHSAGFMSSGIISILAGLMVRLAYSSVSGRIALVAIVGHVLLWPLSFSEVAAAFWGTNQALAIAGGQAGAHGGLPWQETIVTLSHAIPAVSLMAAWAVLLRGMWRARHAATSEHEASHGTAPVADGGVA